MGPISGHKSGPKGVRNSNYRYLLHVNRIFLSQSERKRYVSSLQICLDSVDGKVCYSGKQALPDGGGGGAKWGQNPNYRQFLYGSAIYLVQVE